MTAYHVTEPKNVGAIRRWGLIPRDPALHNWAHAVNDYWGGIAENAGIEAVYFTPTLEDALYWTTYDDVPSGAVLEVDLSGFETEPDTVAAVPALRVRDRIPPDRIRRVA